MFVKNSHPRRRRAGLGRGHPAHGPDGSWLVITGGIALRTKAREMGIEMKGAFSAGDGLLPVGTSASVGLCGL